jgi:hypothetical protein
MKQLLCEPEDRLGNQAAASVSRPDFLAVHARRSGFISPGSTSGSADGADAIKVCGHSSLRRIAPADVYACRHIPGSGA